MKNLTSYFVVHVLLLVSGLAWGQTSANESGSLPPGPLVAKPDSAQWQVTVLVEKTGADAANAEATVTNVKSVTIQGNVRYEEDKSASGSQLTIWCLGPTEFYKTSSANEFCLCSPDDEQFYIADPKLMFPELGWISREKFLGMKNVNGKPSLAFGESIQPLTAAQLGDLLAPETLDNSHFKKTQISKVAYIDLETRLPVYFSDGISHFFYQFGPEPTGPLTVPEEITTMLKMREEQIKRLSAPPARS